MTQKIELPTFQSIVDTNQRVLSKGEPFAFHNEAALHSLLSSIDYALRDERTEIEYVAGLLLWKITQNHVFRQGNKRTAVAVATTFLLAHNYSVNYAASGNSDPLYKLTIAIAKGEIPQDQAGIHLVDRLNNYTKLRPIQRTRVLADLKKRTF